MHKIKHREEMVRPWIYECKECLLQFKKASNLRDHMKEHYKVLILFLLLLILFNIQNISPFLIKMQTHHIYP